MTNELHDVATVVRRARKRAQKCKMESTLANAGTRTVRVMIFLRGVHPVHKPVLYNRPRAHRGDASVFEIIGRNRVLPFFDVALGFSLEKPSLPDCFVLPQVRIG